MSSLLCALLVASVVTAEVSPPDRYRYAQVHMGMTFTLTLYARDEAIANRAAEAAYRRIAQLNAILSDYAPDSELSRLSDTAGMGQAVKLSESLWFVLSRSQDLSHRTAGAFDVTVGPIVKLWRRARRQKQLPDPQRLAAARHSVGYQYLVLDAQQRTATLIRPGMRIDLGGIGAGYAVDEALAVLKAHGITSAMVDGSGDIGVSNPPPDSAGWRIGIAPLNKPDGPPSRYLLLTNAAVTTSGDAFQHVEIDGHRYSHIVDPKTGLGLTSRLAATVVARDCITADSLATAACVLGPERGLALIDATPGASGLLLQIADGRPQVFPSSRFQATADSQ